MRNIEENIEIDHDFSQHVSAQIWNQKYRYRTSQGIIDHTLKDTLERVAHGLIKNPKTAYAEGMRDIYFDAMQSQKVIPAGRILAGAGTARDVTMANTFVMKTLPDSVAGIMDVAKDAALTMKMGGGIGFDFSTLRPKGAEVKGLDCPAAGPLAAMDIMDAICKMLVTGMGRGAMMGTLRCDHPDVFDFVTAKSDRSRLRNFNVSVLITDRFMEAVAQDDEWDLLWHDQIIRTVKAQDLWESIMLQTFKSAEPGVLFIDRINALNPLSYIETIAATNSCAEQPLPPNGVCPLASINLAQLVDAPFTEDARIDVIELRKMVKIAVRMLDDTLDASRYALPEQSHEAQSKRRIGIGVTGVADALAMQSTPYGSKKAVFLLGSWMQTLQNAAYLASAELAKERGSFPYYNAEKHLQQPNVQALDPDVRHAIVKHGLRNGTLTTIAPTGTISMFAGNVSSGVEPIFATQYQRKITRPDGRKDTEEVMDYAVWLYKDMFGEQAPLPESFVTMADLSPKDHVAMQAAAQNWVDSGISKTVNCPEDISFDDFKDVYRAAYEAGCKGCTTYRPNPITGSVLST
jgi:ribonucleoside-diphosphate reductase alpha chain